MRDQVLFDKIDLHLIRVLHTVLTERSVSRAALRLGMYQPAVSAALKRLRGIAGNLGARALRRRVVTYRLARKLEAGTARSGFSASGDDFGFRDILGCAEFLRTQVLGDRRRRRIDVSAAGTAASAGAMLGAGLP